MPSSDSSIMGYDLFVSYARRDNSDGRVSDLVGRIRSTFAAFAGRDLRVFLDLREIQGMDDWRRTIQQSLRESHLFLAVLSPAYLESPYCRWEWEDYVRYEAMRQCLGDGVAPVYFVSLPDAAPPQPALQEWMRDIQKRQAFDLRPWRDAGEAALNAAHVMETLQALNAAVSTRLERAERARRSPTNLMRHNPWFVGRVRELAAVRQTLMRNKLGVIGAAADSRVAAIHGMGGIGKTELALAYAHAFAWDYPGGRWQLRCEGLGDLRIVLQQLDAPLGFTFSDDERKDPSRAFDRVLQELTGADRMLLLLDNVTDGRLFDPALMDRLPLDGTLDLIATTRLGSRQVPGAAGSFEFVAVDALPEDDALSLLRSHQPGGRFAEAVDDDDAREIARVLEGFTLAVETAAIYLGRHAGEIRPGAFLRDLRSRLLERSEEAASDQTVAVRHREALLESTLAFTLDGLSADVAKLLTAASILPADQIALPWVSASADVPDDEVFAAGIAHLRDLRLLQSTSDERVARMHRLVQQIVCRRHLDLARTVEARMRSHAVDRALWLGEHWMEPAARWEVDPLAACARLLLEHDKPDASVVGSHAAAVLCQLARFGEAEPLMRQVHARNERVRGALHADVAASLGNLGHLLASTNRSAEAEPLLRRALAIDETIYGRRHPAVSLRLGNLAQLLMDSNRPSEAEPLVRRALEIDTATYGLDAAEVAVPLNNMAHMLMQSGRFAEAEPLLRRALALDERELGDMHPNVAIRLGNLAMLFLETGRPVEAEASARDALRIFEHTVGPDHPEVAMALSHLAGALDALGRQDETEPLLRRALEIDEARYGPNHPSVAKRLNNLGRAMQHGGRLDEAESLFRRAIAIEEASAGADDPALGVPLNNLAMLLSDTGRPAEAEQLLRRVVELYLRSWTTTGHKPLRIDDGLRNYQVLLARMGLTEEERTERLRELAKPFGLSL